MYTISVFKTVSDESVQAGAHPGTSHSLVSNWTWKTTNQKLKAVLSARN